MHDREHVVAICGSLREESTTRIALREALAAAEAEGATTDLLDLRHYDLPLYGADEVGPDAGDAPQLRQQVRAADAVILGTPVYHGSYASPLKAALDYCTRDEFDGTTVGLLTVAGGRFPTRALDHLRCVAQYLGAWVLPHEVAIPNAGTTVHDDGIDDAELSDRTRRLGRDLTRYAAIDRLPTMQSVSVTVGD